jgi:dienelactone hydrolase
MLGGMGFGPRAAGAAFVLGLTGLLPAALALDVAPVGPIAIVNPSAAPRPLIVFVSGDGGWDERSKEIGQAMASAGPVVVGVDMLRYRAGLAAAGTCADPGRDLARVGESAQRSLGWQTPSKSLLVGLSSGATLVYAALVQAPAGTFIGGISMGFCPDLEIPPPLCGGRPSSRPTPDGKEYLLEPFAGLTTPWYAFTGWGDQLCPRDMVKAFAARVGRGQAIIFPRIGHGFAIAKDWLPQFRDVFAKLVGSQP